MQGCVRGNFKHKGGEAGRENRPGDFSVDFSVDFFVDFSFIGHLDTCVGFAGGGCSIALGSLSSGKRTLGIISITLKLVI